MSYMRWGYPLKYFKSGETKSYVYQSSIKDGKIEDYDDKYEDNRSFCELISVFVEYETNDPEYTFKIVKILAKKLGIDGQLRKEPLSGDEYVDKVLEKNKEFVDKCNCSNKEYKGKKNGKS